MAQKKYIRYSSEFKYNVVSYLIYSNSFPKTIKRYGISNCALRQWLKEDCRKGAKLMSRKLGSTNYTQDFKLKVILDRFESDLTLNELSKKWCCGKTAIKRWTNQYCEDIKLLIPKRGKHNNHDSKFDIYNFDLSTLSKIEQNKLGLRISIITQSWSRIQKYQYINLIGKNKTFLYEHLNISKQSYSYWKQNEHPINAYDDELFSKVELIHNKFNEKGYRAIADYINYENRKNKANYKPFCDKKILRIMQYLNIQGYRNGNSKPNSLQRTHNYDEHDLIKRRFRAKKPNQKWYGDYTYMKINGTFYYVLFIVDGFNKEILHLKMYQNKSSSNVQQALSTLIKERKIEPNSLIFHTDQGSVYNVLCK